VAEGNHNYNVFTPYLHASYGIPQLVIRFKGGSHLRLTTWLHVVCFAHALVGVSSVALFITTDERLQ